MSQISQVRRCYNCGAILQSEDPSKEGYVRKETLENGSQNFLFCDKCFELERYKSVSNEPIVDPDFIKLIKDAKAKNALLVYVINLFSFEASFNHEVCDLLKDMRILVVANNAHNFVRAFIALRLFVINKGLQIGSTTAYKHRCIYFHIIISLQTKPHPSAILLHPVHTLPYR